MKIVNLRIPKSFGERTNSHVELDPKKKYFLVVEGSNTEVDYFNGIFSYRSELNINDLIDIIVVEREDENITDSHPKHLLNGILRRTGKVDVPKGYSTIEYKEGIDEIWLIFDRDPGNFSEEQFSEVFKSCSKNNFKIGLTNPNFEFWLLLHLPDIKDYKIEDLSKNKKVGKNRRFIDKELSDRLDGGYNKRNIGFERFKDNVELAISQEGLFEQKIPEIFEALGSNIGVLINSMRS